MSGPDIAMDVGEHRGRTSSTSPASASTSRCSRTSRTFRWLTRRPALHVRRAPAALRLRGADGGHRQPPRGPRRSQQHLMVDHRQREVSSAARSPSRPTRDMTDGLLDAIAILDASPLQRAKLFDAVGKGKHMTHPSVVSEQSRAFTLTFPTPPAYETDGEYNRARSQRGGDVLRAARAAPRGPQARANARVKAISFAAPIPTYLATLAAGKLSDRFYIGPHACTGYGDVSVAVAPRRAMGAHPHAAGRDLRQRPQHRRRSARAPRRRPSPPSPSCSATSRWARCIEAGAGVRSVRGGRPRGGQSPALLRGARACRPCALPCAAGDHVRCVHFTDGALPAGMLIGTTRGLGGGWGEQFVAHESQLLQARCRDDR